MGYVALLLLAACVRTSVVPVGTSNSRPIRVPEAAPAPAGPAEVYRGCALEGTAQHASRRELNKLKNRITTPTPADIDTSVTLAAMLAPGDDRNRWDVARGVTVTGFVIDVKMGGQETVNCGESEELYPGTHRAASHNSF